MTPERVGIGCCTVLTFLGGLAAGIYLGFNSANGNDLNSNAAALLRFGPAVLGGVLGRYTGKNLVSDPESLDEMISRVQAPPMVTDDQKREVTQGCYPIFSTVTMAGIAGAVTYGGYLLGRSLVAQ